MIVSKISNLVEEKISNTKLFVGMSVIAIMGICLHFFEPYAFFYLLFPILLIMLASIILLLRFFLKEIHDFKNSNANDIRNHCLLLFPDETNFLISVIYIIMVVAYFVCIYHLKFIEMNLMGLYIFFIGGGTFYLALINYEICVRLTAVIYKISKNISSIEYDMEYPERTLWLQYFFHLHKAFKNAALIVSILFVLENSIFFIANYDKFDHSSIFDISSWIKELKISSISHISSWIKELKIECIIIWLFIFVSIILILPFLAWLRSRCLNKIILYIEQDFSGKLLKSYQLEDLRTYPQKYWSILNIIQLVQISLEKNYSPGYINKIISFVVTLLTSFLHLLPGVINALK